MTDTGRVKVHFDWPREPDAKWTADAVRSLVGQRPRLGGLFASARTGESTGEVVAARLGDDGSVYVTLDIPADFAGLLFGDRS